MSRKEDTTTATATTTMEDPYKKYMEREVDKLLDVIKKNESFKDYVVNFNGSQGFMWNSDPRNVAISEAVDSSGHSGASFAICLRECQRRLRQT